MMVGINWQYLVKGMKLLVAGFQLHVMHSWILCRIAPHQYAQHNLGERSYLYFSMYYCTISTVSSVTRNGQKKNLCFKSLELTRKFIGHLGQQIFRIRELTVEMVQYFSNA